jgi:hypothetical protein
LKTWRPLVAREIELALSPEDRWAGGRQPLFE